MASRRLLRTLLVVAVILVAAGSFSIIYGTSPGYVNETDLIPPGWANYTEFEWSVVAGGTVQGTWQALNGTPVQVFVYNDAQYGAYVSGSNLTGLYNVTALSGNISLSVTGFDTYHVVFQHPAGYENDTQYVAVELTSTGADPTFTLGGVAALAIGALLIAFVAVRWRRDARAQQSTGPQWDTFQPASGRSPGWGTPPAGSGGYPVPPSAPGSPPGTSPPSTPPSGPAAPASAPAAAPVPADAPVGTVVVTVVNRSAADAALDLVVNGVAVTSLTVPAGGSRQVSASAKLSSVFGSTVTVEAAMANGRRAKQAVFVGAGGSAPVSLQIG